MLKEIIKESLEIGSSILAININGQITAFLISRVPKII